MGSIIFSGQAMFGSLSDFIGSKSGLALTQSRIIKIFDDDGRFTEFLDLVDDAPVRIDSVTYKEMVELLLHSVGRLEKLVNHPPMVSLLQKFGRDKETLSKAANIGELFLAFHKGLDLNSMPKGSQIDPSPFLKAATEAYGRLGLDMAYEFLASIEVQQELQDAYFPSTTRWQSVIDLEPLFKSEGLSEQHGTYLDQRYIDYISRNFDQIDEMNWRKFEALTAEYFSRNGFEVDLGPGRNDGGVDVRIWPSKDQTHLPPTVIVQCKRQKKKVGKVVVKALYTDVVHHDAKSGLIVTTSTMSPGAKTVCEARKYPIGLADRDTIRQWIAAMRKPGMGVAG